MPRCVALILGLLLAADVCRAAEADAPASGRPVTRHEEVARYRTFITAEDLFARLPDQNLLIIDVRAPGEFSRGHIPDAINIPGDLWRTPDCRPGEGPGHQLFQNDDGSIDLRRYEELFSKWGIQNSHRIVIYGTFAGRSDNAVAAGILKLMGHPHVAMLDGAGVDQWIRARHALTVTPSKPLPRSDYVARSTPGGVWRLPDVLKNRGNPDVVFVDLRTPAEHRGELLLENRRGGHIPGAVNIDGNLLVDRVNRTILPPPQINARLAAMNLQPGDKKTIVLYSQRGTRAFLAWLILRDLGYNAVVYDGGWHEYASEAQTPIEK